MAHQAYANKVGRMHIDARRIWPNSELAKKPQRSENIVVHELVHLLERHHGDRFIGRMDHYLQNWVAMASGTGESATLGPR